MYTQVNDIIYKELKGEELTANEQAVLGNWLLASPENKKIYEHISSPEGLHKELLHREAAEASGVIMLPLFQARYLHPKPQLRIGEKKLTYWFRYAAAIIIMLGIGSYLWFNHSTTLIPVNPVNQKNPINPSSDNHNKALLTLANGQQLALDSAQGNIIKQGNLTVVNLPGKLNYEGTATNVETHTLSTPKGGQYQIVLPDGTKVWLNAASSITYPTTFTGKDRTVAITGEVYFEVTKKLAMPFKVNVNKQQVVEVLGTSFNINAYNDEGSIKTTLINGSVKVISKANSVILKPSQQASINTVNENSVNPKIRLITVQTTNIAQVLAWKNGFFNLQDQSLQEVARQLERWYDIEVKYEGNLAHKNFEGKLDRGVRLSAVLNWFSELGIHNRLEGRTLILSTD